MGEVELPELPELEKEQRKDKLNTLVAITVTLLVTFMAMCKIEDNNVVLHMEQAQAAKVDDWGWMQALNIRGDITQSKLADLRDSPQAPPARIADVEAKAKKIEEKKEAVKEKAEAEEKRYETLDKVHENFDLTEGAISVAVSLLAMTTLLQKRWMYAISLVPALLGIVKGVIGLWG